MHIHYRRLCLLVFFCSSIISQQTSWRFLNSISFLVSSVYIRYRVSSISVENNLRKYLLLGQKGSAD